MIMTKDKGQDPKKKKHVAWPVFNSDEEEKESKTSQELRMLSSVTSNCQVINIVMNSSSQLPEL